MVCLHRRKRRIAFGDRDFQRRHIEKENNAEFFLKAVIAMTSLLSLQACTQLMEVLRWREEVQLHNGQVVIAKQEKQSRSRSEGATLLRLDPTLGSVLSYLRLSKCVFLLMRRLFLLNRFSRSVFHGVIGINWQ